MMYRQVVVPDTLWEQFKAGSLTEKEYFEGLQENLYLAIEDAEDEAEDEIGWIKSELIKTISKLEYQYDEAVKAFKLREIHPDQGSLFADAV